MSEQSFMDEIVGPIKLMKEGHVEMAADQLALAIMNQAVDIKEEITRNGPEDLATLVMYAGPKAMAFGELGFMAEDADESVGKRIGGDEACAMIRETLSALRKTIKQDALIVGVCHEVFLAKESPEVHGAEDVETLVVRGVPGASMGIMVTVVHPYGDEYRVFQLSLRYHYADGGVQFDENGNQFDSVFSTDSNFHEVGGDLAGTIADFFKEVKNEPLDRDAGRTGWIDQVAEHHDSVDGEEGPSPDGPAEG